MIGKQMRGGVEMGGMSKITVVSYCHKAHKNWIPFWADQIDRQVFQNFRVMFVAHNWCDEITTETAMSNYNEFQGLVGNRLNRRLTFYSHNGPPVIGDVIDFAADHVETEFMAHHDLDDVIHPDRLRLQSEFLDAHPDIDFLGTRMVGFNGEPTEEMRQLSYKQPNEPNLDVTEHKDIYSVLLRHNQNCLGHTTMIYRPRDLQAIGGFSRSDVKLDGKSPDFETWKKALMAGYKFHRLPELCALWRLDSSSIRHV